MKCASVFLFFLVVGGSWRLGRATCVLESDFGFILNCAFKKSGLFRVRNLGGIKAHVGLGFSVGDELGFAESISNVEISKRRSAQASAFQAALTQQQQKAALANRITVRTPSSSARAQSSATPTVAAVIPPQPAAKSVTPQITNIPPFKPIPPANERPLVATTINNTQGKNSRLNVPSPSVMGVAVPAFHAMPSSISRISTGPTIPVDNALASKDKLSSSNLATRTLPSASFNELPPPLPVQSTNSIQALATASNIPVEALEAALLLRQQHQMHQNAPSAATVRRPPPPPPKSTQSGGSKVMNAPKEYYPVGYDKNFDDNFSSRVELPETSFYCGDQKHFPGLYADEDLGCMVFHVCALTDDGLIMKSFLCPESSLFDQTILKCNWWFYVDCKSSSKLYDSNIPISKSYQLMKALTFFSEYNKNAPNGQSKNATAKVV